MLCCVVCWSSTWEGRCVWLALLVSESSRFLDNMLRRQWRPELSPGRASPESHSVEAGPHLLRHLPFLRTHIRKFQTRPDIVDFKTRLHAAALPPSGSRKHRPPAPAGLNRPPEYTFGKLVHDDQEQVHDPDRKTAAHGGALRRRPAGDLPEGAVRGGFRRTRQQRLPTVRLFPAEDHIPAGHFDEIGQILKSKEIWEKTENRKLSIGIFRGCKWLGLKRRKKNKVFVLCSVI